MTLISDIEITYSDNPDYGIEINASGHTVHGLYNYVTIVYGTAGNPEVHLPYSFFWEDDLGDMWAQECTDSGETAPRCVIRNSTKWQRWLRKVGRWWWRNVTYHWERLTGQRP